MEKSEVANIFVEFLRAAGYSTNFDSDGDIEFAFEGGNYCLAFDLNDKEYFRIIYPGFWSIDSEDERIRVERAALIATAESKVAKIYPANDNLMASAELFCPTPQAFMDVFFRALSSIQTSVKIFRRQMSSE